MFQPLQTGRLGLTAQQRSIDTIGNNIANLSTTGFKKVRMDFQDNLYTRMFNKEDNSPYMNLQRGTGVREYQSARILTQGALQATGRILDFALEGPGFFVLQNPDPTDVEGMDQFLYTRNGTFYLSVEEDGGMLVDSYGYYVMDENGERIVIPDPEALQCDASGYLYMVGADGQEVPVAQLALTDFVNPGGLESIGQNSFARTVNSGEEVEAAASVRQQVSEASTVDLAEEMTRMIRAQRAFQIAARCVNTADQMMQVANAIRS